MSGCYETTWGEGGWLSLSQLQDFCIQVANHDNHGQITKKSWLFFLWPHLYCPKWGNSKTKDFLAASHVAFLTLYGHGHHILFMPDTSSVFLPLYCMFQGFTSCLPSFPFCKWTKPKGLRKTPSHRPTVLVLLFYLHLLTWCSTSADWVAHHYQGISWSYNDLRLKLHQPGTYNVD